MYINDAAEIITIRELRESNPNVSFPLNPTIEQLAAYGVHPVTLKYPELAPGQRLGALGEAIIVDGVWEATHAIADIPVDEIRVNKIAEINALHKEKLYTDVEVTFPAGLATIQFRDEADRTNLSNVATGAMAYVIAGTPEAVMQYRTQDDVIQQVPAITMMQIAMTVLAAKQGVVDNAWSLKDSLKLLTTAQDILDYDISIGW